ncbi:MAG: endolytic transglycosylase MltG [Proteobacteria bacterium]|nr:endolytic transglycosylase MltG [Pseudomonadota bacterium]MBU4504354.1 endolytic transglycosylase MltG [Pseudomonadota bacterium]
MKDFKAIIFTTLFLLFSGLFCFILDIFIYADIPASSIDHNEKLIIINPGQNFKSFSERLHKDDIIKEPHKFNLLARIKGYDKKIKAGEYLLSSSMPPNKIFQIMVGGKVRLYKLTIPEGYSLNQIASNIAGAGLGKEEEFLRAANDSSLVHEEGIDAETFEGYLFPDTYYFPKTITPGMIIFTMVNRFNSVFTSAFKEQAKKLGLSIHQIVTLASIIEKETGDPEERNIISSVFHNRLKKNMRLESDPAVIYGIKDFDGNIKKIHLKTPTPYNTYLIHGLPTGPIANPGIKAIEAALYPTDTDFLYFVSKKDNTHIFSTNINDHNKAVQKYQLRK